MENASGSESQGPLERLNQQVRTGEIGAAIAIEGARALGAAGRLPVNYLVAVGRAAYQYGLTPNWRDAVRLSMMLRAATKAAMKTPGAPGAGAELATLSDELDRDWIEIAGMALWNVPDARLYADAMTVGHELLKRARNDGSKALESVVLHSLGTLNLDPWFANRSSETYRSDHTQWFMRAEAGQSWDGTPFVLQKPKPMPEPEAALKLAEKFYHDAVNARTGELRARSLKALAQALRWRSQLDKKDRDDEVDSTVGEAITLLDPAKQPALIAELFSYQTKGTTKSTLDTIDALLRESPDAYVRRIGEDAMLALYLYVADGLTRVAPGRALELVQLVGPLFTRLADERRRAGWFTVQLVALIKSSAPGKDDWTVKHDGDEKSHPVQGMVMAALERGKAENWTEIQLAAEFVRLARRTTQSDEELLGVTLFNEAESIAPLSLAPFRDAISHTRSIFFVNCGSNAFHAGSLPEAVTYYAYALDGSFRVGALDRAREVMLRLGDVAEAGDGEAAAAVLTALVPHAMSLVTLLGDDGTIGVRRICDRAINAMTKGAFDADVLAGLWQIAKGLQFGAFLTSGAALRFTQSDEGLALLAQIAELRHAAQSEPAPQGVLEGALASETLLLSPYARSSIRLEGRTARDRLANLELEYEEALDKRLRELAGDTAAQLITQADFHAAIEPNTVLLDLLEVIAKDGSRRLLYSLWTRDDVKFVGQPVGGHNATIIADGVTITQSRLAEIVGATRQSVQIDPGPAAVADPSALEDLQFTGDFLIKPVWEELKRLRATGKRRLCIVPHGPLHYLPFHLLTVDGKPLTDHWSVTYLPNTRLLFSSRGLQGVRKHRIAGPVALGVSFRGSRAPIPEALKEVQQILSAGKGKALIEQQVTEAAVLDAMRGSRTVHIATHGEFQSGAAAFQRVFVTPNDKDDGMLHAYELLGLDGRGLNLVTLSACETALGRFDAGDNLRGLSANLFLAGAETVVGTLWEVETETTTTFFSAMYRALAADASRIDAFALAQRETRQAHPQYRDWGAFYYSGTWS
jgi:CHAT domain-containing protein